ncbi:hypothetical protein TDB9533_01582 [Thalassocella blandensis]|nr:hypothetical protein TDB9533_01582 [Thalassocella blandensis]
MKHSTSTSVFSFQNINAAVVCALLGAVFSSQVSADQYYGGDSYTSPYEQMNNRSAFYVALGGVHLNPVKAYEEGVAEDAWYLKAAFSTQTSDNLIFAIGISGFFYDDYEDFYHEVEDEWGDRWVESSDASSLNLFGEIGYRFNIDSHLSVDLVTGYEKVLVSDRSISDCHDCYSEEIDFATGSYVSPRINYVTDFGVLLGVAYQSYASDDVENAMTLTVGYSF